VTPLLTSATWRRSDATGRPMSATEPRSGAIEPTVAPRCATPRKPPKTAGGLRTIAGGPHTTAGARGTIADMRVATGIRQALTA
jgi:hypothetical protein